MRIAPKITVGFVAVQGAKWATSRAPVGARARPARAPPTRATTGPYSHEVAASQSKRKMFDPAQIKPNPRAGAALKAVPLLGELGHRQACARAPRTRTSHCAAPHGNLTNPLRAAKFTTEELDRLGGVVEEKARVRDHDVARWR